MKPKQFFYAILGFIGVILALAGGGYYLALTQLKTQSEAYAQQLAQQQAADEQAEGLARLQTQYRREIVPILNLIDTVLPREKKQTEILVQLQSIAAGVGLQITSINMPSPLGLPTGVSQTVKAGNVLALPISFQLSGTYDQLQAFTARVEQLNRFTNITNLAISRPDKDKPIIYAINLNAYIKP